LLLITVPPQFFQGTFPSSSRKVPLKIHRAHYKWIPKQLQRPRKPVSIHPSIYKQASVVIKSRLVPRISPNITPGPKEILRRAPPSTRTAVQTHFTPREKGDCPKDVPLISLDTLQTITLQRKGKSAPIGDLDKLVLSLIMKGRNGDRGMGKTPFSEKQREMRTILGLRRKRQREKKPESTRKEN